MSIDYEKVYDFAFNKRVKLANGGTAWLTICANLLSEDQMGEIFAFDDDGKDHRLMPDEYLNMEAMMWNEMAGRVCV